MKDWNYLVLCAFGAFLGWEIGGVLFDHPVGQAPIVSINVSEPAGANPIPTLLQQRSVTVFQQSGGKGSGVLVHRGNRTFVWTAAHVVGNDLRVTVGHSTPTAVAKVILSDPKADLAVLEIEFPSGPFSDGVEFYRDTPTPCVGTRVYHVGSFYGLSAPGSFSSGDIAALDRREPEGDGPFDQITNVIFPGCSGGGVFLTDGRCIGLTARLGGPSWGLMIPVRVILAWAKQHKLEYTL